MSRATLVLVAFTLCPAVGSAQSDTLRRDTTRAAQLLDSTRRVQAESRGQVDLPPAASRFRADLPNLGLSTEQAMELQQALTRLGCDVGAGDGVVGSRTLRGIECFRSQRDLAAAADFESVFTALELSFARPAQPVPPPITPPAPPRRDTTVLPPVLRPDSTYRPDVRARRDSALRRDSLLRADSVRRDTTARRDTTVRRDTTTRKR